MSVTTPMKLLLALVTVCVIAIGFYVFDWQRCLQQQADLTQRTAARQQDYHDIERQLHDLPALVERNRALQAQLTALLHDHMARSERTEEMVSHMLISMEQTASRTRTPLSIISVTPSVARPTAEKPSASPAAAVLERLPARKFALHLQGDYASVLAFLDAVGELSLDHLVTIDAVALAPVGGRPGASPELSISLPITAYSNVGGQ